MPMNHFFKRLGDKSREQKPEAPEGASIADFVAKDRTARVPAISERHAQLKKQRSHFLLV